MEKIILDEKIKFRLFYLVEILFMKEYFSYKENAEKYVRSIYDFIYSIPTQPRRRTKHSKYGQFYCRYKANAQTT